jgi:type 2 lantibiotic biosynthesis protein LanM
MADRQLSVNLYDGACGIGVFLAALAQVTGKAAYRDLALEAWVPVATSLNGDQAAAQYSGIGGCSGLGGIVYGSLLIGRMLHEDSCIEWACQAASRIDEESIGRDREFDVASGSAGAILGILALYQHLGEPSLLQRAMACGDRLLAAQRPAKRGGAAWPGRDGTPLAGFAHGAAGIAYALTRLYEISRAPAYLTAAQAACVFERGVFLEKARNWPVLAARRRDGGPLLMVAWCHGASGIGLARLAGSVVLQDDETRREIQAALATTIESLPGPADHLCCGSAGRIELLLTAGLLMKDPALIRTACETAFAVVRRKQQGGGFDLEKTDYGRLLFDPGLFRGISGIGYTLLRLARPEALPSVLAFEPPP